MKIKQKSIKFSLLIALFFIISLLSAIFALNSNITEKKINETGLPTIFINTEAAKKIKSKEKYLDATFSDGISKEKCKIRGHGNSTWKLPKDKKSYLLKFSNPTKMFDMEKGEKWILFANMSDQTSLRNSYATHIAKTVFKNQRYIPNYRFANIILNNRYEGLYCIFEKIEEDRMEIEDESFLFEVNHQKSRTWTFYSKQGISFCIHNNDISEEKYLKEQKIIQDFEDLLFSDDFLNSETGYKSKIDLDSFVDWYLINEFTKNKDSDFEFSCYLYYDAKTQKFGMGPIWDFDLSCGGNYEENFTYENFWVNKKGWFKRFFEDEEFFNAVKQRWNEQKIYLKESFNWITEESKKIEKAAKLNDSVWKTIGYKQWPHIPNWESKKTYQSHIEYMKTWLEKRYNWLDEEFNK